MIVKTANEAPEGFPSVTDPRPPPYEYGCCPTEMAYADIVTTMPSDTHFDEEAGERIQQGFALCAFASELVGKASEE